MKRILLIVISVVTLTFSGCASVPQGVKSNMEKYNSQEKEQSDFKFSYIDISNLQSTSQEAILKNYGQFEISDNINLKQPSEINIMSFKPVSGFLSNSHKAMNLFFTEDQLSKQKIYNDGYYYEFSNENEKLYCSVCDDGFIAMLNPETFDISFSYSEPNLKVYHIDRKDNLKDEYQLNDQKCTVEEAVEYVDNWLDTKYKTFSNNLDYNVKTVIVREHNNKYLFEFSVEALYNEIPIDSYTAEMDESSEKMIFDNYRIEIQMINKNSIDSFTNRTNGLIPSVEESLNECISLESALEYCQHTFTDFKNIEISDIGIIYTLSPVYEYDSEQRPYIVKYNSHPVWEFIMDVLPEEILSEGQVNTNGYLRRYIYIDMVTGECNYNFNIISQGLGNNMKKVYYSIIIELKKNIINYGFFMCIIITAILCFTSEIYIDPITGQEYSVIAVITNMNQFSSDELTAVNILHDSVSPYITIFLPVISSIPFISVFCSERISGNMRFIISRISRYKYYISKFISAAFSGGFSVMLGFILYSSIILLMFENNSCSITELLKIYAGMGIYGMFSVAPAFFISSFVKNKYIICCFPFILMHFYYTFLSKIQDILISNDKWDIMVKMSFLYPSGLKEIFFNTDVYNLAYNFLLTIAAFGGFVYIMNRRVDYGQ